ncbi:MAG: ABC transporter permease [Candidatus Eisenbacteria bacterium]|uniref:ABC transporter permease n=1 Tax=Eiseniibacteriota bacterium TaxID=2212470 RepID=A0A538SN32_UNCEI|nr:MAG: ABC transporter permease [Candidatus Eisenbacteria bacterium]
MTHRSWSVWRKELRDALRDGRTIIAVFVVPFVLYPGLMLFMGWIESQNKKEESTLQVRVGVVGEAQLPAVRERLQGVGGVSVVPLERAPASMERAGVDAVLVLPPGIQPAIARGDSVKVELLYKDADHKSSAAEERTRPVLDDVRRALIVLWAQSHGAQVNQPPAISVEHRDVSSKAETGRFIAALVIPYILVFMVAAGSMHIAIDTTTGEKERSTLETLLSTSTSRGELVLGKCMAVITTALTAGFIGIFGLWFNLTVLAGLMPALSGQSLQLTIRPDQALFIFLTVLPTAIFLGAALVAIGCFARSMREGQTYATYVYMAAVFLGLGSFRQVGAPPIGRFEVPILNTALLQREILTDTVVPIHAIVAIGMSAAMAAVMLVIATRLFSNESVLFRT